MTESVATSIENPPAAIADSSPATVSKYQRICRWSARLAVFLVLFDVAAILFFAGIHLRRWTWDQTLAIRFDGDVANGYQRGSTAIDEGLFNVYPSLIAQFESYRLMLEEQKSPLPPPYGLDYPPLRLTVMSLWVRWTRVHFPGQFRWNSSFEFNEPILRVNYAAELASAIGVFLLIRAVSFRFRTGLAGQIVNESPWRKYLPAAVAAILLWFNPAIIFNDAWPQWDVWIVPFFIFALYAAVCDFWFVAGCLLATGAMLKGQILLVSPAFLLWPVFTAQWKGLGRILCGFAVMFTAIAVPWTLTSAKDIALASTGTVVAILLLVLWKGWRRQLSQIAAAIVFVLGIWLTPKFFTGDLSWYKIGFKYGSEKFMHMGEPGTSNLAMLLQESWGWSIIGPRGTVHIPVEWLTFGSSRITRLIAPILNRAGTLSADRSDLAVTMRTLLGSIYAFCLLLCSIGAAIHWKRKNPRFLLAMYAPWVLFFAILPQMNNRYLFWGGALASMLVAAGGGYTLLGLLMSVSCCAMMADIMYRFGSPDPASIYFQTVTRMYPGLAYAILLAALVFLYGAINPRKLKSAAYL